MSHLEERFLDAWTEQNPRFLPIREHPIKNYRFDFAWLDQKVLLEVHGNGPGHQSPLGMTRDAKKQMEAVIRGWTVIFITTLMLKDDNIEHTLRQIEQVLRLPPKPTNLQTYLEKKLKLRENRKETYE